MVGVAVANKTFAELLTELREATGMERSQLADKAGVAYESIRRYEEGKRTPKHAQVKKIASVLGRITLQPLLEAAGYGQEEAALTNEEAALTPDEVRLLTVYRALPEHERPLFLRMWLRGARHEDGPDAASTG